MKVSVITACYNSESTIASTVRSVLSQTYADFEYLLIDGQSQDKTLDIIREQGGGDPRVKIFSEPDRGVYDAMNKGIDRAQGELVAFLNSDDFYADDRVLESVVSAFMQDSSLDGVYGNIIYVDRKDVTKDYRKWISGRQEAFTTGWHPAHPAFFIKRAVYERYGNFDLRYSLAADFELMLRFSDIYHIRLHYLPDYLVRMRRGGMTNNSWKNIIRQNRECIAAFRHHGIPVNPFLYLVRRLGPKVLQFLR